MRGILLVGLLALVGCTSVEGPRQRQFDAQPVDAPWLTLDEQQRRGRDQLAYPVESPKIAPPTFSTTPGPHGR